MTMMCQTDGYPKPKLQWFLNGITLAQSDKFIIENETGNLLILNAGPSDEGMYACEASNQAKSRKSATLVVKSKTEIINGPEHQEVQVTA